MEVRQIKLTPQNLIAVGVKCPFCGQDNTEGCCEHFESVQELMRQSETANVMTGSIVYTFRKRVG